MLCDGILGGDSLRWRAIDGLTKRVLREIELPFDPIEPTKVIARLEFELMDLLGINGLPHVDPELRGELTGCC